MKRPSDKWQDVRKAALERARRTAVEPLNPLYSIYFGVCVCYLAGLLRFQFFDPSAGFTWVTATQLLIVAVAGALLPILTGSVLTLHFANRKLQRLADECGARDRE
ncbi:hypothetical protein [Szabonella alba]|uniref:DUF485 domain-containing protein n=1 Tax=Szabonella alba TaxID=2804194 RepID=A0A8K0VFC8_9RHOB|nr:hypothetical protein [Szabonella alba]MBL4918010.1 hypothetical protein [Szabonella alba]